MKNKEFKNHKGEEFLFVKLPKNATRVSKGYDSNWMYYYLPNSRDSFDHRHIELNFDYKIIAPLSEMTEEIWREIIPTELIGGIGGVGMQWLYPDYLKSNCYGFETATESGKSLMQSLGIYLVNPFGKHPDNWEYIDSAIHMYKTDVESWEKKEANTGNWIILKES